jgi:hypothetical protein
LIAERIDAGEVTDAQLFGEAVNSVLKRRGNSAAAGIMANNFVDAQFLLPTADTKKYSYEKRAIYKAAQKIQQTPILEFSFKLLGGRPTALNNEKGKAFINFIREEFEKAQQCQHSSHGGKPTNHDSIK